MGESGGKCLVRVHACSLGVDRTSSDLATRLGWSV